MQIHVPPHKHMCNFGAGPLPVGRYTIGELQRHANNVGQAAMALIPNKENIMIGRDAFYIHGDSSDHFRYASDGCIIISTRKIREGIGKLVDKGENLLQVVS